MVEPSENKGNQAMMDDLEEDEVYKTAPPSLDDNTPIANMDGLAKKFAKNKQK
jgi:hypothetical protein